MSTATEPQETQPHDEVPISLGIIGERQLLCVQTFDIARHPSAAVGLIPGCFVAVAGKGPTDSNESGKTSWLAAVSLLLGDPEWRMHGSGPASVADLLFEPQTAGIGAQGYAPATTGYIAGLFADPGDVPASVHTVWLKLSATPTYVEVRHAPGIHLATAQDDVERHDQATEIYRTLPSASALGATQYATALYGPVPRCLAFLTSRGKRRGGPSLLKLDTGLFTPAGIGTALIELTGRATLLDTDASLRHDLSEAERELQTSRSEDITTYTAEERALHTVIQRISAREELGRAQDMWALHYARGLLDALDRTEQLQAALGEQEEARARARGNREAAQAAQRALDDPERLARRHDEAAQAKERAEQRLTRARDDESGARHRLATHDQALQDAEDAAAGVHGNLDDARLEAQQAHQHAIACEGHLTQATALRQNAQDDLARANEGRYGTAGQTISILSEAGIHATGLLDGLTLAPEERAAWEPRLALYRDAVCIATSCVATARAALVGRPGAVLIAVPDTDHHDHDPVQGFLDTLAARMHLEHAPDTAVDNALGLYVLGGYAEPLTGRASLLTRLRAALDQAEQDLDQAQRQRDQAMETEAQSADLVRRLESAALTARLRSQRPELEDELAALHQATAARQQERDAAQAAFQDALVAHKTLALQHAQAQAAIDTAQAAEGQAAEQLATVQQQIDDLDISYWQEHGGNREAALRALRWPAAPPATSDRPQVQPERRSENTLRQRAGRHLERALEAIGIDVDTGAGAPTSALKDAVRLRNNLADDTGGRRFADATAFEAPIRALKDWLDRFAESDASAANRIAEERAGRASRIAFGEQKVGDLRESLRTMQGSIALRLEQALGDIEDALVTLNRDAGLYGAELRRTLTPPPTLQDMWRCEVTPYWRRTPHGPMLPYDNITNSAQEKLFSIHLVLASLLASPHPRGRLLILDELGDSLGSHHRREVLGALAASAQGNGITVLGTCQESLLDDATEHSGELLYFNYPSHTEALNAPTRMFGYDANGERVELTMEVLLAGRTWW
ncbi:coiled-coil domain-containing protein [Streptomyces europaeiscabiei]|uniref:hypothetical protein n=1 Tax=Streptomyces europaeiscabiei TaxID=146819 RepID=UPI0029BCBD64|nr:hypothetical protein [Streptomyces europaeiscabiei]MDX3616498.1 hypothetical protein [Streptomyces europaeiscabiei]